MLFRSKDYNANGVFTKLGYLLIGTNCQIPKCSAGQYFKWNNFMDSNGNTLGQCVDCHHTCGTCLGPLYNNCTSCLPGQVIQPGYNCLTCTQMNPGLFTNEDLECEDLCGDGVVLTKACDDGNLIDGDGCSSKCTIEYGYICPVPNQPCLYKVQPTFTITSRTDINQHFVQFSAVVNVLSPSSISPANMVV